MNPEQQEILVRLGVAALGGFAIGVEREWSAAREKPNTRFGGVRTFQLLGLIGALAAIAGRAVAPAIGAVLVAGAIAVVAVSYFVTASGGVIDATTEIAAVVVLGTGLLAGAGFVVPASAVNAVAALALVSKSRLHGAVAKLRSEELEAASRFAALALVLLPLLPKGPFEAWGGIEPRKLWALVLLFAGLSFAGYIAMRLVGRERGWGVAGLLGGLVSSTAVTFQFARESRRSPAARLPLALGVVAACTILPIRVGVLSFLLHRPTAQALLPALAAPTLLGLGFVAVALFRGARGDEKPASEAELSSPLRLGAAIQMVVLFQGVLWALDWARERLGESGIVGSAAIVGLTDLDALTFSTTELAKGGVEPAVAARALLVGLIANTAFKGVVAGALGAAGFRLRVLAALAAFAGLFAAGLLWI